MPNVESFAGTASGGGANDNILEDNGTVVRIRDGQTQTLSDFDNKTNLTGKVVLIEGADPGFDWIFSQNIKALVTKYGGVNSHMAIRCAEFGIPAAIGCGEQRFERLQKSNQVSIDCSSGLINPIE